MFARFAFSVAKPAAAARPAAVPTKIAFNVRFMASQATAGSKGRDMPYKTARATTPAPSLPATFTIRVRAILSH